MTNSGASLSIERRVLVGDTALALIKRNGLFALRFGEYEFEVTYTSEAQANAVFDEERFALACGMDYMEEGSGWHRS